MIIYPLSDRRFVPCGAYSSESQREVDIIHVPIKSDMQELGMFMGNTAADFTPETWKKVTHRNSLKTTQSVLQIKTTVLRQISELR